MRKGKAPPRQGRWKAIPEPARSGGLHYRPQSFVPPRREWSPTGYSSEESVKDRRFVVHAWPWQEHMRTIQRLTREAGVRIEPRVERQRNPGNAEGNSHEPVKRATDHFSCPTLSPTSWADCFSGCSPQGSAGASPRVLFWLPAPQARNRLLIWTTSLLDRLLGTAPCIGLKSSRE
jgi:hypothetical protein